MTYAGLALILALGTAASGQIDPDTPPTTRVLDCTTSGCHAPVIDHVQLHGPTAVNACDVCHVFVSSETHTFRLKNEGTDLCAFCHIDKVIPDGPVVHEPFGKGECIKCHDPHGGETKTLMRSKIVGDLCIECHTDSVHGSFIHEPAAEGRCTECHRSHSADHENLLPMPRQELCLSCHTELRQRIESAKDVHEPVSKNCLECHDAHGSDIGGVLKLEPRALCVSCHEAAEQEALAAAHKHSAVFEDRACLNCHQPHASPHGKLIADDGVGACLECHSEPIVVADNRVIQSIAGVRAEKHFVHGPIKEQTCTGCHLPHGAELAHLLKARYTSAFYQPFNLDAYALCFQCHRKELALEPETVVATNFRDGSINLHWVHVNKPEKGRTCTACHGNHATTSPRLIVDSVPYGQWRIPLNFKLTETGGSCASGCHNAKTYDRGQTPPVPAVPPELTEPDQPANTAEKAETSDGT